MRPRLAAVLLVLGAIGLVLVARGVVHGVEARARRRARSRAAAVRPPPAFDVSLPLVPVGVARLTPGGRPLLVHYWAPWERHGRAQVLALDSLARTLPAGRAARGDRVLRPVPVGGALRGAAAAPRAGHARPAPRSPGRAPLPERSLHVAARCARAVVAAQPGEVEWLAPATRALLLERRRRAAADSAAVSRPEAQPRRPRRGSRSGPRGLHAGPREPAAQERVAAEQRGAVDTSEASVLRKNGSAAV
jgi:hypothetical protein